MTNISDLPRNPVEALKVTLVQISMVTAQGSSIIQNLKKSNHHWYVDLLTLSSIARQAALRIENQEFRDSILASLDLSASDLTMPVYGKRIEHSLALLVAMEMEDHFISPNLIAEFDEANLSVDDKEVIRALIADVRKQVDTSTNLKEWQRRNILFHAAKIENELHREKTKFQTFVAAAADVSGLVRTIGEDAQPIADAIEKARTITQKKVSGYNQIEKDKEPRQLPKPDSSA